ncbi:MAG: hypothetical protein HYY18_14575 [Planctomycetes bacterium]|nr:hypothetical protein [Planctomycetota bacterium]
MRTLWLMLMCAALGRAEDPPAYDITDIVQKIRSGTPAECVEAVAKLPPGKEERAAGPIATRLKAETDGQVRAALRDALVAYKPEAIARALKGPLEGKDTTDEFRTMALEILAACKIPAAVDLVVAIAFKSEMKAMRDAAQKQLVDYGDLAVADTAAYVRAPDQKIANEAVAVLKTIDTEPAAKQLVHFLVIGSEKEILRIVGITNATREEVIKALIEMGDEAAPALLGGLDSNQHQQWCSYVLQKISGEFHTQKDKAGWMGWWKRRLAEKAGR